MSVKAGSSASAGTGPVAGPLEAVAAVVPTGITATYTVAAIALQKLAISSEANQGSAVAAALAAAGKTKDQISAQLALLPGESHYFVWVRWLLFGIAAASALLISVKSASVAASPRTVPIVEPLSALLAFSAWGLASIGTPLGAYLQATALAVSSIAIGVGGVLVLGGLGNSVLSRPVKS